MSESMDATGDVTPDFGEQQQEQEAETGADTGAEPGAGSGIVRVFGRQLKRCRVRAGLERQEFGAMVGYSASTIAAFEQGRRIPPPRFIDQANEVLDAGGVLLEMKDEVAKAQYPPFFQDAAQLEVKAVELHVYATQAVPGLLQTPEYATAVFRMWRPVLEEEIIEHRLAARLERQAIFARRPRPHLTFVIEEAVLHRRLGSEQVWRGQLEQVLLTGQVRNVALQVMPLSRREHAGLAGPFTLMEVKDGRRIAYTEVQSDSRLHMERNRVRELEATYGCLRAQALTPEDSLALVEKLLRGE